MVNLSHHDEQPKNGNGRERFVTALLAAFVGVLPASGVYVAGSRPTSNLESRLDRIEREQIERSNRFAIVEARAEQNKERVDRLEKIIDELRRGGK